MKRPESGFTLFEVMLGVVILAVLAGGIFGTISGVVSAADVLQTEHYRRTSRNALVELLRKEFSSLPPKPGMRLEFQENANPQLTELWIENAPRAFAWGRKSNNPGVVVLGSEKTSDGLFNFVLKRLSLDETIRSRTLPEELVLVEGIRMLRW